MSVRVSGSVSASLSERIQWKIPDIITTFENKKGWIHSPTISCSGCNWDVSFIDNRKIILTCWSEETAAQKTVTCYVGSERADFNHTSEINAFAWVFTGSFNLGELKRRRPELAPSNTVTITFYVEVTHPVPPQRDTLDPPREDTRRLMGLENLSSCFEDLFVSKEKTDATMKVEGKDFSVHKAVLVARSSVFSAMFEHDTSEEQTGVVKVPDCDPDSFQDFLHHLYTGKFDGVTSSNAHHLYVTADKYDVQLLKSFCVDHMKQNLTVENVLDVVVLADRYEEPELLSMAQDFFNDNFRNVISKSRWRTLMKEDFELAYRLLLQIEPPAKVTSLK